MSKILRKTASIFGGSALAGPGGIAQFGSTQAGSPVYSLDPAIIVALPAWANGWGAGAISQFPVEEEWNGVDYYNSYQSAYLLQQGIAEWDSGTTYYTNSICQYGGLVYQSLADGNLNKTPDSSPSYWKVINGSAVKGENLFRNAGFAIAQRGTSGTIAAGQSGYTLDGWIVGATGNSVTWGNSSSHVANTTLVLEPGSWTRTDCFIKQRIESSVIQPVPPNTYFTVQAAIWNNSGSSFTPKLTVNYPTSADNYGAVTNYINAVNLQPCPSGQVTIVAYTFAMDFNLYKGMEVIFDFGNAVSSSDGIEFGQADISTTPFLQTTGLQSNPPEPQIRPIGIELPNCQRYFQSFGGSNTYERIGLGYAVDTTYAYITIPFKTKMRAIPEMAVSAANDWLIGNQGPSGFFVASSFAVISAYISGINTFAIDITTSANLVQFQPIELVANNTLNARLTFSAEL